MLIRLSGLRSKLNFEHILGWIRPRLMRWKLTGMHTTRTTQQSSILWHHHPLNFKTVKVLLTGSGQQGISQKTIHLRTLQYSTLPTRWLGTPRLVFSRTSISCRTSTQIIKLYSKISSFTTTCQILQAIMSISSIWQTVRDKIQNPQAFSMFRPWKNSWIWEMPFLI